MNKSVPSEDAAVIVPSAILSVRYFILLQLLATAAVPAFCALYFTSVLLVALAMVEPATASATKPVGGAEPLLSGRGRCSCERRKHSL
jgi:hypothetical protein